MASIAFTYGGNFDPTDLVTMAQNAFGLDYIGVNANYAFGPTPGPNYFVLNNNGDLNNGGAAFTDANRNEPNFPFPIDAALRPESYSVSVDFSDNVGFVFAVGGDFGDILRSGSAADTLDGGAGNDVIEGGAGGDTLVGGAGIDTLSYEHSSSPVYVDLGLQSFSGGDAAGDTATGFENLLGSSADDSLVGDGNDNVIEGGGGADWISGGGGFDTASYVRSSAGVVIDLFNGTASGGDADGDVLFSGTIQGLRGSHFDDSLTGDGTSNTLDGMTSSGPLGDALYGLAGNDTLILRDDPAMVDGGADTDTAVIWRGADVTFAAGTLVDVERVVVQAGASVDFSALATATGTIRGLADVTIVGSQIADRIVLVAGDNTVTGGAGKDVMLAGAGSDTFVFATGSGRDTIRGIDAAHDHLDFSALGLDLGDLTFRTAANGTDTMIYAAGQSADVVTLKGILLDKASLPDGFLIL